MSRFAVLIVAAGKGERTGFSRPKQYEKLGGLPVLRRTVMAFAPLPIQVVIGPGQEAMAAEALAGLNVAAPVMGGATRQESVRRGLEAMAADAPDFVLIHDAARPFVTKQTIRAVAAALEGGARGVLPMIAVTDTLRRQAGLRWDIVDRTDLFRAQTPQGFVFADILAAHRAHAEQTVTDDVALAELAGVSVLRIEGDERNIKLTTREDFALATALLPGGETRSAMGYDAHRFVQGDHVWLCGIKVAHTHGLAGHSDADAGLHALTDALLGTIGAGDIGQHFSPNDERWRGAPSHLFLAHAAELVAKQGGHVIHCDVTLICEGPRIGPHRDAMRARIAEILNLSIERVSVKATTTEGMGFTGRAEGLAAQAIVTVRLLSQD
jgi:2-C-methyl-D-erythritol 4-phosphate cytidylyltransferase/2-C-methyl-D-erythritol 2,4-cyclodiphosphate synthase